MAGHQIVEGGESLKTTYAWLMAATAFASVIALTIFLWIVSAKLLQPHWVRTVIAICGGMFSPRVARFAWLKARRGEA